MLVASWQLEEVAVGAEVQPALVVGAEATPAPEEAQPRPRSGVEAAVGDPERVEAAVALEPAGVEPPQLPEPAVEPRPPTRRRASISARCQQISHFWSQPSWSPKLPSMPANIPTNLWKFGASFRHLSPHTIVEECLCLRKNLRCACRRSVEPANCNKLCPRASDF